MPVILAVEMTDLLFAVDSIPAVLGVCRDPFVVYTSNIAAILGLRSLYFALASMLDRFRYLHYGLGVLLVFIAFKMLAAPWFELPVTCFAHHDRINPRSVCASSRNRWASTDSRSALELRQVSCSEAAAPLPRKMRA